MLQKHKWENWVDEHPSVSKWLDNFHGAGTKATYKMYAYKFFKWIHDNAPEPYRGKSPEELLDMHEDAKGRKRYAQVDLLQTWLNSFPSRYTTKQTAKVAIYSFYLWNRVPLPRDVRFKINADKPQVNGSLKIEELRQLILSCNELYQAVYMIMWQSAMATEDFLYFNTHCWDQVKEQLDDDKRIIRVDLPGRKHNRMKPRGNFFTFFGKDAIDKLKRYLIFREQQTLNNDNALKLEEAIFINEKSQTLTKQSLYTYFKRHAMRLGIIKKKKRRSLRTRYRVHLHEMRDTFRTEWNLTNAKSFMAEFFMGHVIDFNNYNKVMQREEWAKQQYKLAEPYLNILSEDPRTIKTRDINKVVEERVKERTKTLQDEIQELRKARERNGIDDLKIQLTQLQKEVEKWKHHFELSVREKMFDDAMKEEAEEQRYQDRQREEDKRLIEKQRKKRG